MHHKSGVHFENYPEVKFRDILLTGTGHRDRRLNRGSPGQTGTYGRSSIDYNITYFARAYPQHGGGEGAMQLNTDYFFKILFWTAQLRWAH